MPELPEVETIRLGLSEHLLGQQVESVMVLRDQSIAHPNPPSFVQKLQSKTIQQIRRRGKYLIFELGSKFDLIVHLGMSGRLLFCSQTNPVNKFVRVRILLEEGKELRFEDMRVFGRMWLKSSKETIEKIIPGLNHMGIEPLPDLTGNQLNKIFANKSQSIKAALLDQKLIAGIGNIYADESLFKAGIHPAKPSGSLSSGEAKRLAAAICQVLSRAIKARGSSIRDYTDSQGVNGNYQNRALVYGRTGEKCGICKSAIERIKIAGRSTHFCPVCQINPRSKTRSVKRVRKTNYRKHKADNNKSNSV